MFFETHTGKYLLCIGGVAEFFLIYRLGKRKQWWTTQRGLFFFLWIEFLIPMLFLLIDIGIEDSWIRAILVYVIVMLTAGPIGAYFFSIYLWSTDKPTKKF